MRRHKIYYTVGDTLKYNVYSEKDCILNYDLQTGLIQILDRNSKSLKALWSPHNYVYLEVLQ